jgi:hypothetical protein
MHMNPNSNGLYSRCQLLPNKISAGGMSGEEMFESIKSNKSKSIGRRPKTQEKVFTRRQMNDIINSQNSKVDQMTTVFGNPNYLITDEEMVGDIGSTVFSEIHSPKMQSVRSLKVLKKMVTDRRSTSYFMKVKNHNK